MTFKWILTQFWTALGSVWEALGSLSLPRNRRKLCSQPNYAFKWIWGWFWQALGKVFGGSVRRNDLEYKPVPIFFCSIELVLYSKSLKTKTKQR